MYIHSFTHTHTHTADANTQDELRDATGVSDAMLSAHLRTLKKRKLALKDQIARLERLLQQSLL